MTGFPAPSHPERRLDAEPHPVILSAASKLYPGRISPGVALALSRTRIWLVFGAPLAALLGIGLAVFVLLRLGTHLMTRGRRG
jgi:hypothetical protein